MLSIKRAVELSVLQSAFPSYIWAELSWVVPFCAMVSMVTCQRWPDVYKMPWCVTQSMKGIKTYIFTCGRAVLLYKKEAVHLECYRNLFFKENWLFLQGRGVWLPFSNLNCPIQRDGWLISGLWCEDICSGADGKSAVGIDQSSKQGGKHFWLCFFSWSFSAVCCWFCFFPKLEVNGKMPQTMEI